MSNQDLTVSPAQKPGHTTPEKVVEVLSENLKETFKSIEKYIAVGFTSCVLLAVIAATNPTLSGTQRISFIDISAPVQLVVLFTYVTYIVSGAATLLMLWSRGRLVQHLRQRDVLLTKVVLTYPSLVAKIGTIQLAVLLLIMVVTFFSFSSLHRGKTEEDVFLFGILLFNSPYIAIFLLGFITSVKERDLGFDGSDA